MDLRWIVRMDGSGQRKLSIEERILARKCRNLGRMGRWVYGFSTDCAN